jgi:hypothetical protein
LLIGFLSARMSLSHSIAAFGFIAYGCTLIALLMLPETLGRTLISEGTDAELPNDGEGPVAYLRKINN